MAKVICPNCNKKFNAKEEICPYCGQFYSTKITNIDAGGRPFSAYQESMHQEHYDKYNVDPVSNTESKNVDMGQNQSNPQNYEIFSSSSEERLENQESINYNLSDEEVYRFVKKVFKCGNITSVFGGAFAVFFTLISIFMLVVAIISTFIPMIIMAFFFAFIGIIVITKNFGGNSYHKKALQLLQNGEYRSFMNYVDEIAISKKVYSLLYGGSIVCFYKLNEKEKSKNLFLRAIKLSPYTVLMCMTNFGGMIKALDLEKELENIDFSNHYHNYKN